MEFTVSNEEYVTLNDETLREILMDELYLLTNSRRLIEVLQNHIGEEFILFRTNSKYDSHKRLILTHKEFHKSFDYYNIKDTKRYRCVGYDEITGEAMMRQINGSKSHLKYSKDIQEWAIIS